MLLAAVGDEKIGRRKTEALDGRGDSRPFFFQKALAIIASQQGGQLSIPVPVAEGGAPGAGPEPGDKVSPGGIVLP